MCSARTAASRISSLLPTKRRVTKRQRRRQTTSRRRNRILSRTNNKPSNGGNSKPDNSGSNKPSNGGNGSNSGSGSNTGSGSQDETKTYSGTLPDLINAIYANHSVDLSLSDPTAVDLSNSDQISYYLG